jgi:hypothetical protein
MSEPALLETDAATAPSAPEPPLAAIPAEPLEQRVQRLEMAVTALQNTQALEDRLVERVAERLQGKVAVEAERLASAERRTTATAVMAAAGQTLRAVAPLTTPTSPRAPLLVIDLVVEFVAICRMFFDFRYKIGWPTRVLILVLLAAILTSHLWFPGTNFWIVGDILDKLIDLALAFVLYKALSREAQRYVQTRSS